MKTPAVPTPPLIIQGYNASGQLVEAVIAAGVAPATDPTFALAKLLAKHTLRPAPLSRILSGEHTFLLKDAQHWIDRAYYTLDYKATRKNGYYTNRKWVRLAGRQAYQGLQVSLTTLLGKPAKGQSTHAYYRDQLTVDYPELVEPYRAVYAELVQRMGHQGHRRVRLAQAMLANAESLVDQVALILEDEYMNSPTYLALIDGPSSELIG